ncbi:SDR family NAD(P)-dependent oxidoreductase [Clostridiaceae bacterium M8S5]|nr:SDR family NAD(P)-dependent oxidoreductase [Clostridiaceae bacterium M8S5]
MESIEKYIFSQVANHKLTKDDAKKMLLELKKDSNDDQNIDIAVIGMSGKFAESSNLKEYWQNILKGKNSIRSLPNERKKDVENYLMRFHYKRLKESGYINQNEEIKVEYHKRGYLTEIDKFDAKFFRIPPREANAMDPFQRIFLEVAYEAFEDAGYCKDLLEGSNTAVYVGMDHVAELQYKRLAANDPMVVTGTWPGILASRVSYILNLKGPAIVIDTACSSGLVSIHQGCQAILNGECDMALAGGLSNLNYVPLTFKDELKELESVESKTDEVRTFDQNAAGTVWGEGVGAVVLKKLTKAIEDGDPIHAVIKGSVINNDGASNGITAPDADMQKRLLTSAWQKSKIDPNTLSYMEAHGTGTKLGDPIEIKAITQAFNTLTDKKQFCAIGSVKSSIGHLVAASGLASFIKVILMIKNKVIPATINFEEPNRFINFSNSPVYVTDKKIEWKSDIPRTAGVSAFGFSGTNSHVILQEAPEIINKDLKKDDSIKIITISAKTTDSLKNLLKEYNEYLEKNSVSLENFSYTTCIGRSHYAHRIALIARNVDELKTKIRKLMSEIKTIDAKGIYYGSNKIVSKNKPNKNDGEITETQKRNMTKEINKLIKRLRENTTDALAKEVCSLYVKGASAKWDELFNEEQLSKINIPYYPFEKTRYWYEVEPKKEIEVKSTSHEKEYDHPYLDRCLVRSIDQDIYVVRYGKDRQWVLGEHKIFDNHVLPGTTYIEMVAQVCKNYYSEELDIRDIIFYTPLILEPDEERDMQIIVNKKNDYLEIKFASKLNDEFEEIWIKHCECKVYEIEEQKERKLDINTIINKFSDEKDKDNSKIDLGQKSIGIDLGHRWENEKRIGIGKKEIIYAFELADDIKDDYNTFRLHVGILDNAMNIVSQKIGTGTYLPYFYKSFKLYKSIDGKIYSYIRINDKTPDKKETISFDIDLVDMNGEIIASVEDYNIKRVNKTQTQFKEQGILKNKYFNLIWKEESVSKDREIENKVTLVFNNSSQDSECITEELRKTNNKIIEVNFGQSYRKINDFEYIIANTEIDYIQLFKDIKDKKIERVVHLFITDEGNPKSLEDLKRLQEYSLSSLFYSTRAILKNKYSDNIELVLVADNANKVTGLENIIKPHGEAYLALGKVINWEYDNLKCRCIDIDKSSNKENIVKEIQSYTQYKIAYRKNKRYVQEFGKVDIKENRQNIEISSDGVYVVTGGTGGLGLEMGKYLAKNNASNIALISRSSVPKRGKWDEILIDGKEKKLIRAIESIKEMESKGAKVHCVSADVCSLSDMEEALDNLRKEHGKLKGVIHCAGKAGDGLIITKDKRKFDSVIAPKMYGTWILDDLTKQDELDFFIMFSSMISVFGDLGQSDYAASNAYMDSFASYRGNSIAINWPSWKETGMAVDYGVTESYSFINGNNTAKALSAFEEILNSSLEKVMPGELNYMKFIDKRNFLQFKLSKEIEKLLIRKKINKPEEKKSHTQNVKAKIKGECIEDYSDTENCIKGIWCEVLGMEDIDVYEGFYALGGDSLMAIQLLKKIEEVYPEIIDISDIFTYSTIEQMAKYINDTLVAEYKNDEEGKEDSLENMLDDLESGDISIDNILEALND